MRLYHYVASDNHEERTISLPTKPLCAGPVFMSSSPAVILRYHVPCVGRWLLVWFKRELAWQDVQRLWEVLWTRRPGPGFVLLVALAVLVQQRSTIMESSLGFSAIVKVGREGARLID